MKKELFMHFEKSGKLTCLSLLQSKKFEFACKKAVEENPTLSFNELIIACQIYLNFIVSFPDLDLGPIMAPFQSIE